MLPLAVLVIVGIAQEHVVAVAVREGSML